MAVCAGPEDHDVVHVQQQQRMTALSDPSNARSWYATSRSRVSTGICMTAPGIPMLFMGQEFLEDKQWSEDFSYWPNQFIYWDGLNTQKQMGDFLRYTTDIIALRWQYPALRGQGLAVTHSNNQGRVLVYHRWIPGEGKDVVVVVHLGNNNTCNYRIGFPFPGKWKEAFNSDFYENCPNPDTFGNGGQVYTDNQPYDGLSYSASLNLPANGILIFTL
jgi:1,4-alpha-glucan branching enzyme